MNEHNSIRIKLSDAESITTASALLHDAVFSSQSLIHDPATETFHMDFWREADRHTRTRQIVPRMHCVKSLRVRTRLTFHDVQKVAITVHDQLTWHSWFGIEYRQRAKQLIFDTEGAIDIKLTVRRLAGVLVDTKETTWEQFGYSTLDFTLNKRNPD